MEKQLHVVEGIGVPQPPGMRDYIREHSHFKLRPFAPNGEAMPVWQQNDQGRKALTELVLKSAEAGWSMERYAKEEERIKTDLLGKLIPGGGFMQTPNLIVDIGLAIVSSRITGSGGEAIVNGLAVGTDNTSLGVDDLKLVAEVLTATDTTFDRQIATLSQETTTKTDDTARLDTTFGVALAAHALVECGAFQGATSDETGVMLARSIYTIINIAIGGSLQLIYDFPIT